MISDGEQIASYWSVKLLVPLSLFVAFAAAAGERGSAHPKTGALERPRPRPRREARREK